jgi:hypothetical protein
MNQNRARLLALLSVALLASLPAGAEPPPRFPEDSVWHTDIRYNALHPQSDAIIARWNGLGGFGFGRMQIDFGFHIVHAPANAPTRTIVGYPDADDYYAPDCSPIGTAMPVPTNAAIEANAGLTCDNAGEDCHLLVVQGDRLYEAYRANAVGGTQLQAQCLAVWKLRKSYPVDNRGDHCTGADAAGFPIAPLLFNADEVYAAMQQADGELGHAIRFILPNARMASVIIDGDRFGYYVRPASHAGGPSGPTDTIPYGSRLRLKADFPVNLYPAAAQVILRTMQHHGIVLSDGGNIALTAESDLYTTRKWAALGIHSRIFDQAVPSRPLRPTDFELIDTGPKIVETYDCVRNDGTSAPSQLRASVSRGANGRRGAEVIDLRWEGGAAANVDVWRGAAVVQTVDNVNRWQAKYSGPATTPWRICNAGTSTCSNAAYPAQGGDTGAAPAPRTRLPRTPPDTR